MKSPLADQPGCWVVWAEDLEGNYVSVYDDELEAYRDAHCGGGISLSVTWVPWGMSVQNAVDAENEALKVAREKPAAPDPAKRPSLVIGLDA